MKPLGTGQLSCSAQHVLRFAGASCDGSMAQVCALLNGARKAGATHALLLMPVTLLDQCPGCSVYDSSDGGFGRGAPVRTLSQPPLSLKALVNMAWHLVVSVWAPV